MLTALEELYCLGALDDEGLLTRLVCIVGPCSGCMANTMLGSAAFGLPNESRSQRLLGQVGGLTMLGRGAHNRRHDISYSKRLPSPKRKAAAGGSEEGKIQ